MTNVMTTNDLMDLQSRYVMGTYSPELVLVRGEMSWVWDIEGRRYLDFGTGISVCNLGHCHPRVTEAIQRQAAALVHVSNLYYNANQPRLAAKIAAHCFGSRTFFGNSGAEANEGMIKLARKWGHDSGRHEIICMEDSFHGRTLATLAATGRAKYRKGFQPDVEGFVFAPFNDLEAVAAKVGPKTVAVMLEPVQGEGGVVPGEREFLEGVRALCDEKNLLLLFDEVQCGMGRTGAWFGHQHYGVEPDAMTLAKAIGNGMPMGALVVKEELADVLTPGTHASTFGGAPLACAAGVAVFETIEQDDVLENVRAMSAYLWGKLAELSEAHPCIESVRGLGLMIGIVMTGSVADVVAAARAKGLLLLSAGENVLRMLPPLTVSREEIDHAAAVLDEILNELK